MERKYLKPLALLLAVVMLLAMAACGSGGAESAKTDDGTAQSAAKTEPSGGKTASSGEPKHLNAAIYWSAATIDPAV